MLLLAFAVRILIALYTRTVFQPDEYYQALEPAHHLVFGYGHLTWEWLSPRPIRSILYPGLNVPIYWLLKITGLDLKGSFGRRLIVLCPRLFHGAFAAATDVWLCKITKKAIGPQYVSTAFLLSLTSPFHALALSRSLSNSLETSLTTLAFSYYPWDASSKLSPQLMFNKNAIRKMLIFAGFACATRPTNAIIWIYPFINIVWSLKSSPQAVAFILKAFFLVALTVCSCLFILDSIYYGKPTFTPYNFLLANASNISSFYGINDWHYYLTQALPVLTTTALPFLLHNVWVTVKKWDSHDLNPQKNMLGTIIVTISVYSISKHKEWRFIHPVLPLLHILAAKGLVDLSLPKMDLKYSSLQIRPAFRYLILANLPIAAYLVFGYCSAPISAMAILRNLPPAELQGGSIGFLTPCHSTPLHTYLHRKELAHGGVWALGCEPPPDVSLSNYRDQTTVFFDDPLAYLKKRFPSSVNPRFPLSPYPTTVPGTLLGSDKLTWKHEWPRYIVLFGALLERKEVKQLLDKKGYSEVWSGGRWWEGDVEERRGGVKILKWKSRA